MGDSKSFNMFDLCRGHHVLLGAEVHFRSVDLERLFDREKDRESLWFLSRDGDLSLRRSLERDRLRLRLRLLFLGDLKKRRGKASERTNGRISKALQLQPANGQTHSAPP